MNSDLFRPPRRSWTTEEAFVWCQRIASDHYENFPVASWLLPAQVRPHIAAVYAFARIADDIADEPGHSAAERLDALSVWERHLDAAWDGDAEHPVFIALMATAREHHLPRNLLSDLLSAFRQDVTPPRYATFSDVLDYCRRSADPVGRIVLRLFGHADDEMDARSDAICTALQLTNFWQDLGTDVRHGRFYIPEEDLLRFSVTVDQLQLGTTTPAIRDLLAYQVDRTHALFNEGEPLMRRLNGRLRLEIRLTRLGGMRILDKIEDSGYTVLEKRPKLAFVDGAVILGRLLLRPW